MVNFAGSDLNMATLFRLLMLWWYGKPNSEISQIIASASLTNSLHPEKLSGCKDQAL